MFARRPFATVCASVLLLGIIAAVPRRVAAQIPAPTQQFTLFAGRTTDGQGIVVIWGIRIPAFSADSFLLFRGPANAPVGTSVPIATLTSTTRAYTDYNLPGDGIWCYQLFAVSGGILAYSSLEICAVVFAGIPGEIKPIIAQGCNQFYQTLPVGTSMRDVAARFSTPSAVLGIWRYDAAQQRFVSGYFADTTAPTDFSSLPVTGEFEYVCLTMTASYG
jgi:hypothetical protein